MNSTDHESVSYAFDWNAPQAFAPKRPPGDFGIVNGTTVTAMVGVAGRSSRHKWPHSAPVQTREHLCSARPCALLPSTSDTFPFNRLDSRKKRQRCGAGGRLGASAAASAAACSACAGGSRDACECKYRARRATRPATLRIDLVASDLFLACKFAAAAVAADLNARLLCCEHSSARAALSLGRRLCKKWVPLCRPPSAIVLREF